MRSGLGLGLGLVLGLGLELGLGIGLGPGLGLDPNPNLRVVLEAELEQAAIRHVTLVERLLVLHDRAPPAEGHELPRRDVQPVRDALLQLAHRKLRELSTVSLRRFELDLSREARLSQEP